MSAPDATVASASASRSALRIAIILPYGSRDGAYFSDVLEARMCAEARALGHRADLVRVYYEGDDGEQDARVGARLLEWLEEKDVDVVVSERLFDPAPIARFRAGREGRRVVLIALGEVPRALDAVDFVFGEITSRPEGARLELRPADQLLDAWEALVACIAEGDDERALAGVSRVAGGALGPAMPLRPATRRRPFAATVEAHEIALGEVRPRRIRTLHGTYGCPYSGDPLKSAHHAGLSLPTVRPVSRLGCAFCHMGGDYVAGTDASIVADLVEQARFWQAHEPTLEAFLLSDQHPIRYLGPLVAACEAEGLRPTRWLFAARADAFVREQDALESALVEAARTGHRLAVYLMGFESFSPTELERYNKGVDVETQLEAVRLMRVLRKRHPLAFEYTEERGHSLILWNPWTRPSDLRESLATIRENGLRELFDSVGRNRLRLHPNLPIHHAAERDRALADSWDEAGDGAGRRKGYGQEHPWRFLDARTGVAHALARALVDALGRESELAQLLAVVDHVERPTPLGPVEEELDVVMRGARALGAVLARLVANRGVAAGAGASESSGSVGARRARATRAARVVFAGACNNGCRACSNRDRYLDDDAAALHARIASARATGMAVLFDGREPTMHPAYLELLHAARGDDARLVSTVTNGRRFAYARFAMAARSKGLRTASVRLFGADAPTADAYARVDGAFDQALSGIRSLGSAGIECEVRATLHRATLDDAERMAELAASVGARALRIELPLDALGLDALERAADAVARVEARSVALGLALEVTPLGASSVDHALVPTAATISSSASSSSARRP